MNTTKNENAVNILFLLLVSLTLAITSISLLAVNIPFAKEQVANAGSHELRINGLDLSSKAIFPEKTPTPIRIASSGNPTPTPTVCSPSSNDIDCDGTSNANDPNADGDSQDNSSDNDDDNDGTPDASDSTPGGPGTTISGWTDAGWCNGCPTNTPTPTNTFTPTPTPITYQMYVYVDQPGAGGDDDVYHLYPFEYGHAFFKFYASDTSALPESIKQYANKKYGFYPTSNIDSFFGPITAPGALYFDGTHPYDVQISFDIPQDKMEHRLYFIQSMLSSPPTYNLNSYNCVDAVINAASSAGLSLPDPQGSWPINGYGSNPGMFGYALENQ